jgi:hypothetical protein
MIVSELTSLNKKKLMRDTTCMGNSFVSSKRIKEQSKLGMLIAAVDEGLTFMGCANGC